MNNKLIAVFVAVSGFISASAAHADITAYGRIHNSIEFKDDGTTRSQDLSDYVSMFGFKFSDDIGNGMSAFARYEFGATTDHAPKTGSGISGRLAFVGLSGPFGSVSLGQQWSAYYRNVGIHASAKVYSIGPGQKLGPNRTGNTLKYFKKLGPISLMADARVDDEMDGESSWGNGFGIGATLTPTDNFTLAGAFDSNDPNDKDTMGITALAKFDGWSFSVSHEQQDQGDLEHRNTWVVLNAYPMDRVYLRAGLGRTEKEGAGDAVTETDRVSASATYKIGGGLRTYVEYSNEDHGTDESDTVAIGFRIDF